MGAPVGSSKWRVDGIRAYLAYKLYLVSVKTLATSVLCIVYSLSFGVNIEVSLSSIVS